MRMGTMLGSMLMQPSTTERRHRIIMRPMVMTALARLAAWPEPT